MGGAWISPEVRKEARELVGLCLPIVASNALLMLLLIEDQVFLGHLGTDELAAAAIGTTIYNLAWYPIIGASSACDTFCAQAYGAGDLEATDFWTRMGFLVMTIMCVPAAVLFQFSDLFIEHVLRQPHHLAKMAGRYTQLLLPGLWFVTMFCVMQKSLQARGILMPSVWIMLASNVLNVGGNALLIHTLGLGFDGSPLATSASRIISCAMMAAYYFTLKQQPPRPGESATCCRWWRSSTGTPRSSSLSSPPIGCGPDGYHPLSGDAEAAGQYSNLNGSMEHIIEERRQTDKPGKVPFWEAFRRFMVLAIPGGFMVGLEAWSFDWTIIFASKFGNEALDAHQSMMSISALTYLSIPLAIATAATIRIGNLLGAQQPAQAKLSARICMVAGVTFMGLLALLIIALRDQLGKVFSPDPKVVLIVKRLAPIMAIYQVMDGWQGVCAGVLRGMGWQSRIATLNLCGFWVLGLPGGALLAFVVGLGVYGIWWGFVIGLMLVSLLYAYAISRVDYHKEARRALLAVTDVQLEHQWEDAIDHSHSHSHSQTHSHKQPLLDVSSPVGSGSGSGGAHGPSRAEHRPTPSPIEVVEV